MTAIASFTSLKTVYYEHDYSRLTTPSLDVVANQVLRTYEDCKTQRSKLERVWEMAWEEYYSFNSEYVSAGDVYKRNLYSNTDLSMSNVRNRINAGKVFEQVETAHAYLMSSLFPNGDWFKVNALAYEDEDVAKLLTQYIRHKNTEWQFYPNAANYLRQLIVTGFSAMALPYVGNSLRYEVLDVFDVFFDITSQHVDDSMLIRRVCLTKSEIITHIKRGYFDADIDEVCCISSDKIGFESSLNNTIQMSKGLNTYTYSESDKIWALEYWGDLEIPGYGCIQDVMCVVLNGKVVRLQQNRYKCGKPFVVSTYIPVIRQQAGIGLVQPMLGMAKASSKIINLLLDGGEVSINPMYTLLNDSVLSDEELKFRPGTVLRVNSHDSLRPLPSPNNNYGIGVQNLQMLTDNVSRLTGISNLLSQGMVRSGERVTATEISEAKAAGGNRLLNIHTHIQHTFLYPLVRKVTSIVQQYSRDREHLKVESSGNTYYVELNANVPTFQFEYWCSVSGAEHVIEANNELDKRMRLLEVMLNVPEFKERLNFDTLLSDIIRYMNIGDSSRYIKEAEPEVSDVQTPESILEADEPTQNMIQANQMVDGGTTLAADTFGVSKDEIGAILNATQQPQQQQFAS